MKQLKNWGGVVLFSAMVGAAQAGSTEALLHEVCAFPRDTCDQLDEPEKTACNDSLTNVETICHAGVNQAGVVLNFLRASGTVVTGGDSGRGCDSGRCVTIQIIVAGSAPDGTGAASATCIATADDPDSLTVAVSCNGLPGVGASILGVGAAPVVVSGPGEVCGQATAVYQGGQTPTAEACATLEFSEGAPIP